MLASGIIPLLGHCIATWYAKSQYLVNITQLQTSWGVAIQLPNSHSIFGGISLTVGPAVLLLSCILIWALSKKMAPKCDIEGQKST